LVTVSSSELNADGTTRMFMQLASDQCVRFQGMSFAWLMDLVFVWIEHKVSLHSFPTNFEQSWKKF
jgi:hypothetical protein